MKILSHEQLREADRQTILNEPISSLELMERAAQACHEHIRKLFPNETRFHIFCGMGNNGGDGLVVARLLAEEQKCVSVYVVHHADSFSDDCAKNLARLDLKTIELLNVRSVADLPKVNDGVLIDAMLGSGITRKLDGLLADLAGSINTLGLPVVAIDLPSGIFDQGNAVENLQAAIKANYTLTFQAPKLCCVIPESAAHVGEWFVLDIGLDKAYLAHCESSLLLFGAEEAGEILRTRSALSHKGVFGHALIAAGSLGKSGAAVLSSRAALRAGAGLVSVFAPGCAYEVLQTAVPEAMVQLSDNDSLLQGKLDLAPYTCIGVGPGIGTATQTIDFLRHLFTSSTLPLVIDADALNGIAQERTLFTLIPKNSILTPHPKEFDRLFGKQHGGEARLSELRKQAQSSGIVIVLKGHYTAVALPDGTTFFNTTGNAGMATAGSGDVLTGIITALLAQGYPPEQAASLGVYLHGLAGDLAVKKIGQEALIASDLIENLGAAFLAVHEK